MLKEYTVHQYTTVLKVMGQQRLGAVEAPDVAAPPVAFDYGLVSPSLYTLSRLNSSVSQCVSVRCDELFHTTKGPLVLNSHRGYGKELGAFSKPSGTMSLSANASVPNTVERPSSMEVSILGSRGAG